MSKNKGFSITSADRHSLALYELASDDDVLELVESQSSSILNLILSNKDFSNQSLEDVRVMCYLGRDFKIIFNII